MLAELGGKVAINYQNSEKQAHEVVDLIRQKGGQANAYRADVSQEEQANTMVEQIVSAMGPIQVLVNNAGVTRDKSFIKMTKNMWDEVLGVNLNGPFNVTHAVLAAMIESKWGRIVNVASIVGQTGNFGQANYAVTKGGLIAFTMTLAREVARKGITVNAVAPGYIETDMIKDVPETVLDQVRAMTPLGRLGKPEEVAAAICFLAEPRASYINGQVLPVNGGMYM
jgi:NAD(P)-dependent dehydrogenase (short-subunit alcohol dehydrogenase family)